MSDPLDDPDDDFGGTPSRTMTLDELRGSIRPMSVLERVEKHAMGTLYPPMDVTELRAAELFLKKTQPDLKSTEVTGKDGGPIEMVGRIELVPLLPGKP